MKIAKKYVINNLGFIMFLFLSFFIFLWMENPTLLLPARTTEIISNISDISIFIIAVVLLIILTFYNVKKDSKFNIPFLIFNTLFLLFNLTKLTIKLNVYIWALGIGIIFILILFSISQQ